MDSMHRPPGFLTVFADVPRKGCSNRYFWFLLALGLTVLFINCGKSRDGSGVDERHFSGMENAVVRWDDAFVKVGEYRPSFSAPGFERFTLGVIYTIHRGHLFVRDFYGNGIHELDDQLRHVRAIGKKGPGPGEYEIPINLAFDNSGNLYIFDIGKFRLLKYLAPDFCYEKDIVVRQCWQDFFFTPDNRIVAYTSSSEQSHNLELLDITGKTLRSNFEAPDKRFHIFQSRFKTGKLYRREGREFVMTYPLEYALHFFDMELKRTRILKAKSYSEFMPAPLEYPAELSPYEFNPSHARWWGDAHHPSQAYELKKDVFAVQMLKYSKLSVKEYVNIHDIRGHTLALGLEVPEEGAVHGAWGDMLYVLRQETLSDVNKVESPVLVKYRLKI